VFRTADGSLVVELGSIAPTEESNEGVEERGVGGPSKDFDYSSNELWSMYGNVAERYDESRIRSLKDDMDGIPVYVCTFSSVVANLHLHHPYSRLAYYPLSSLHLLSPKCRICE